jgi:hypothetical protein
VADQTVCPRCGARDSFMKGYLPETCVCRICQSQLDWREIPGCGPDCTAGSAPREDRPAPEGADVAGGGLDVEGGPPKGRLDGGSVDV